MKKIIYLGLASLLAFFYSCDKLGSGGENIDEPDPSTDELFTGWMGDEDDTTIPNDVTFFSGTLPAKVDLTPHMPPVGDQGPTGTCVAWATGYYMRTGMNAIRNGLSTSQLTSTSKQFSPKDLFWSIPNDQKGADCNGTHFEYALSQMQSRGVATMQTVPFQNVGDCSNFPLSSWTQEAANFRIKSFRDLPVDVNSIKTKLSEDRPLIFGAIVTDAFLKFQGTGVMKSDIVNSAAKGGHAMTIVGYDDAKQAFRILNSWGKNWGDNGYAWVHYDLMTNANFIKYVFVAYDDPANNPVNPNPPVNNSYNVAVSTLNDNDDPNSWGSLDRVIDFNVANRGSETLQASDGWDVLYLYFNAYDANDFGVLLHERFTDEYGWGNGWFQGLGSSYSEWRNADIEPGSDWGATVWGSGNVRWPYTMESISGYYYMVMVADAFDTYEETDESDNYFYMTNAQGGPIWFIDGVPFGIKSSEVTDRSEEAAANARTPVNAGNLNAYTPEEITGMIRHLKQQGKLPKATKALGGKPEAKD